MAKKEMTQRFSFSKEEIKEYLFHELTPSEQEKFEEQLLEDNDFVYEVLDVENDLVDRYVLEKLMGSELSRFDKSLHATPARKEKVYTALALQRCIAEERQMELAREKSIAAAAGAIPLWKRLTTFIDLRSASLQFAVLGLFIVLTVGIVFLLVERQRVNQELAHLRKSESNVENPEREKNLQEQIKAAQEREANLRRQIESERGEASEMHEQLERTVSEREKAEHELEKLRREQSNPTTLQTPIIARKVLQPVVRGQRGNVEEVVLGRNTNSVVITMALEDEINLKEPLSIEINGRKWPTDVQLHNFSLGIILASISIAPQRFNDGLNTIVVKDAGNQEVGNYELFVRKQ